MDAPHENIQQDCQEFFRLLLQKVHRETRASGCIQRFTSSFPITKQKLVSSYLNWKRARKAREDSKLGSLVEGHFLVQIDCGACGKQAFSFEAFRELALDLVSLEVNRARRRRMETQFDALRKMENLPDFSNGLASRFGVSSNFQGLLSVNDLESQPGHDSCSAPNNQSNPFSLNTQMQFHLFEEASRESAKSGDSDSLLSRAISSFNSSTDSQKNSFGGKVFSQFAKDTCSSSSRQGLSTAQARRVESESERTPEAFPDVFLEELVRDFFAEDYVSDYRCAYCRRRTLIKKQYRILKEPEVLTLTLKRFMCFPQAQKIHRAIFIEKEAFDFSPFLYRQNGACQSLADMTDSLFESRAEKQNVGESYCNPESFNRSISLRRAEYGLAAYIEHKGNLHSGHYVAFVKRPADNSWLAKDDERVFHVQNHSRKLVLYNPAVYSFFLNRKKQAF